LVEIIRRKEALSEKKLLLNVMIASALDKAPLLKFEVKNPN
jgi:hypothetical protein